MYSESEGLDMIYTHGYTVFKDEDAAREYVKKEIQEKKEFWEGLGKECSEIVEKVRRKGNKETHIFSFTFPDKFNYSEVAVMSNSYVAKEI